jgi:hypothetical protein
MADEINDQVEPATNQMTDEITLQGALLKQSQPTFV